MVIDFLLYVGQLLLLTLGTVVLCGLAAWLAERLFVVLVGSGSSMVVYLSSVIGTPIHELGHAMMCPLFAHRITKMRLLLPPKHPSGTLGYVSHSYNSKNPWAILGNLFIGLGPVFSGMGVMVLVLLLCFPTQWQSYTEAVAVLPADVTSVWQIFSAILSLLGSMPMAFGESWWRPLIGIIVILSVSQHITLSGADIKSSLTAIPLYVLLLTVFAGITALLGAQPAILSGLWAFNLRLFSIFAVAIAFSGVWILIGLLVFGIRMIRRLI